MFALRISPRPDTIHAGTHFVPSLREIAHSEMAARSGKFPRLSTGLWRAVGESLLALLQLGERLMLGVGVRRCDLSIVR